MYRSNESDGISRQIFHTFRGVYPADNPQAVGPADFFKESKDISEPPAALMEEGEPATIPDPAGTQSAPKILQF